jgi:hypothetical protein
MLGGCIEGPEPDSVHNITPRSCETGLALDQTFTLTGDYELARQSQLQSSPPRFVLDTPSGEIAIATTVGAYGELALQPMTALPNDAELSLRLVDPGALAGVYIPTMLFPTAYSTRSETVIRSYRAVDNHVFVSFSQPLDATTVAGAVSVSRGTAAVSATAEYLDAPGHVVHIQLFDSGGAVSVGFGPQLRTKSGTAVFSIAQYIDLDSTYTVPIADGCQNAE